MPCAERRATAGSRGVNCIHGVRSRRHAEGAEHRTYLVLDCGRVRVRNWSGTGVNEASHEGRLCTDVLRIGAATIVVRLGIVFSGCEKVVAASDALVERFQ